MNSNNKINELNEALKLKTREEELRFGTTIIHLNLMHQIQKLLDRNKMSHSAFAKNIGVSEAYVSKLFSADKFLNLEKIAAIQKLFNVQIKFGFNYLAKAESKKLKATRSQTNSVSDSPSYDSYNYPMVAKSKDY